mmetsp:Transcript_405/g.917  ORF Transcript_405/g.917 Transcript_405/m.917 type:complete len:217 (-) Transcript_405:42-692(-)
MDPRRALRARAATIVTPRISGTREIGNAIPPPGCGTVFVSSFRRVCALENHRPRPDSAGGVPGCRHNRGVAKRGARNTTGSWVGAKPRQPPSAGTAEGWTDPCFLRRALQPRTRSARSPPTGATNETRRCRGGGSVGGCRVWFGDSGLAAPGIHSTRPQTDPSGFSEAQSWHAFSMPGGPLLHDLPQRATNEHTHGQSKRKLWLCPRIRFDPITPS